MALLIRIIVGLLAAYVVAAFLMWRFQDRLTFPAPRSPLPEPQALGFADGARVELLTSDAVVISGWYFPPVPASDSGGARGLLWFVGNMETVDVMAPIVRDLRPPATGLLIINYRGYGDSHGRPSEDGVYRDAQAAWDYLAGREEIDPGRIAIYGRSVGSVPALFLTERNNARAVILDSPFTNARDMARQHYGFFPRFLVKLSLDNLARIKNLQVPVLIFHGEDDLIAPAWMGRTLADSAPDAELVLIPEAGHNDTYAVAHDSYRSRMHEFLDAHLRKTQARDETAAPGTPNLTGESDST